MSLRRSLLTLTAGLAPLLLSLPCAQAEGSKPLSAAVNGGSHPLRAGTTPSPPTGDSPRLETAAPSGAPTIILKSDRVPVPPRPELDSSMRPNPILVPPSVMLRATGNAAASSSAPSVVVVTKEAPSPFLGPAESAADRAIDRNQNALLLEKLRKDNRVIDHDRPFVMVVPLFDRSQSYAGSAADTEIDRLQRTQFIDRYLYRY